MSSRLAKARLGRHGHSLNEGNVTPKEVKEGLARRFGDHFKNMPPSLLFTEDLEGGIERTVPIRLFCAELLS